MLHARAVVICVRTYHADRLCVLQCGRVGKDEFVCDHNNNAMSGLQAFAIALAVFTWQPHYMWL